MLRLAQGRDAQPSAAIFDSQTMQSTPESGHRAGYDGHKRKKGTKLHLAVDTLGQLLALHVTPANEQDRAQVQTLATSVQDATGEHVELVYVDQGYTGDVSAEAAAAEGIELIDVQAWYSGSSLGYPYVMATDNKSTCNANWDAARDQSFSSGGYWYAGTYVTIRSAACGGSGNWRLLFDAPNG